MTELDLESLNELIKNTLEKILKDISAEEIDKGAIFSKDFYNKNIVRPLFHLNSFIKIIKNNDLKINLPDNLSKNLLIILEKSKRKDCHLIIDHIISILEKINIITYEDSLQIIDNIKRSKISSDLDQFIYRLNVMPEAKTKELETEFEQQLRKTFPANGDEEIYKFGDLLKELSKKNQQLKDILSRKLVKQVVLINSVSKDELEKKIEQETLNKFKQYMISFDDGTFYILYILQNTNPKNMQEYYISEIDLTEFKNMQLEYNKAKDNHDVDKGLIEAKLYDLAWEVQNQMQLALEEGQEELLNNFKALQERSNTDQKIKTELNHLNVSEPFNDKKIED